MWDRRVRLKMDIARALSTEGIVLLENNGILPLTNAGNIALFGSGARDTIKGGTGSGDVNTDVLVTIEQGLINAGFEIQTTKWLERMINKKQAAVMAYHAWMIEKSQKDHLPILSVYLSYPMKEVPPEIITEADVKDTETNIAIYVISRNSGEGADRICEKGDYLLFDEEKENLRTLTKNFEKVIVVLNIGGILNLTELNEIEGIDAVVLMSQLGSQGGNSLADILVGKTTPSGKLADTWAKDYWEYPSSKQFSHNNGSVDEEYYTEGIYVGYRYFNTNGVEPLYCFGYGKSYTDFTIQAKNIIYKENEIEIQIVVKNIGNTYSGKEVVQVYASAPEGTIKKAKKVLVGFVKTDLLLPGIEDELVITVPKALLASYSEEQAAWILEKGIYQLYIGNSSVHTNLAYEFEVDEEILVEKCDNLFKEYSGEELFVSNRHAFITDKEKLLTLQDVINGEAKLQELVAQLSVEEMAMLCVGTSRSKDGSIIGTASEEVPGAAGDTSPVCEESRGIGHLIMADGPAGLRLQEKSTAYPIGWAMAQSWNIELIEEVGRAIAGDMKKNNVDLWLAPALNIHRNPLCGRNYEYYSEDPLLTGKVAAAIIKGVQSESGCGVTMKHFAVNNQEENRYFTNANVGEQALREIYLKGFEIAVKEAQPIAVMTSYNLLNGIHTANHYGLLQSLLRDEWGFDGFVMTDWFASQDMPELTGKYETKHPISSSVGCIYAGNNLQMPGCEQNVEDIIEAVNNGLPKDGFQIAIADLQHAAYDILKVIIRLRK